MVMNPIIRSKESPFKTKPSDSGRVNSWKGIFFLPQLGWGSWNRFLQRYWHNWYGWYLYFYVRLEIICKDPKTYIFLPGNDHTSPTIAGHSWVDWCSELPQVGYLMVPWRVSQHHVYRNEFCFGNHLAGIILVPHICILWFPHYGLFPP